MKYAIVTLCLASSIFGASLPGRETSGIGVQLLGYTPPPYPYDCGPWPDYITNISGQPWCTGGVTFGFIAWPEDEHGTAIPQSGVGFMVADVQSMMGDSGMVGPGINNWPDIGKVVDCTKRKAASTIRTNKHGKAYIGLSWGAMTTSEATRICNHDNNIASRVTGKIQLRTNHVPGVFIGADLYGLACQASVEIPDSRCWMRATGSSWYGRQALRMATMSMEETPDIIQFSEMSLALDEDATDANRLPQAALDWPGIGWHRLALDNTFDTYTQQGMAVLTFEPNEPKREFLSATEAWVYCAEITWPQQPQRLARIMQGYAVGMNYHSENKYFSDYLFFTANAVDVGPQVDDANNPCYILPLSNGMVIVPVLSDSNVPDVIGRYLTDEPESDLNADGTVDLTDFSLSALTWGR